MGMLTPGIAHKEQSLSTRFIAWVTALQSQPDPGPNPLASPAVAPTHIGTKTV